MVLMHVDPAIEMDSLQSLRSSASNYSGKAPHSEPGRWQPILAPDLIPLDPQKVLPKLVVEL
ncbi:hypothetical protein N7467_005737 [Penicillium canescens]|nr:hypothetical protein N7467_005737 [Penicillium canescens]